MKRRPRTIEERIRAIALSKIKVRITKRTRSTAGFTVESPDPDLSKVAVLTKAHALQNLLARVRCMPTINLTIKANK